MDDRPAVWVGHVVLATHDLHRSFEFYGALGLRQLREPNTDDVLTELEMRGGTHLVLVLDPDAKNDEQGAPFDLMVDDLDALHATLTHRGIDPSPITRGGHDSFTFRDPDGYIVTINSSHVEALSDVSTKTCVALLRGINLGRRNKVTMADLRALLESLGYNDVRTHLQRWTRSSSRPPSCRPRHRPRRSRASIARSSRPTSSRSASG